jgi:hypothetical protein
MEKETKIIWLVSPLILILLSQTVIATPPAQPCDEKIGDKKFYENIILSNDIIKQINNELELFRVDVADCFVGNRLEITMIYKFPINFSSYGIRYTDDLILYYLKNGSIELDYYGTDLKYDSIVTIFEERINKLETNSRVKEFITKLNPTTCTLVDNIAYIYAEDPTHRWSYYIKYHQMGDYVREYSLPTSDNWTDYSEIKQAQKIVMENPLDESLNYSIDLNSVTAASDYQGNSLFYMYVPLISDHGRNTAFLQLNPNGSYERLNITGPWSIEATSKNEPDITPGFELVLLVIAFALILIWMKKKKL